LSHPGIPAPKHLHLPSPYRGQVHPLSQYTPHYPVNLVINSIAIPAPWFLGPAPDFLDPLDYLRPHRNPNPIVILSQTLLTPISLILFTQHSSDKQLRNSDLPIIGPKLRPRHHLVNLSCHIVLSSPLLLLLCFPTTSCFLPFSRLALHLPLISIHHSGLLPPSFDPTLGVST